MMIDKRLIKALPQAKKYVWLTVVMREIALLSSSALIFAVAALMERRGQDWQNPVACIILCGALVFSMNLLSAYTGFKASADVKKTLRAKIYDKLLRLGSAYQEQSSTAKIVQLAVEGVEQLETWFGAFLPQFYYSMLAAVTTFLFIAFQDLKMALVLLACVPLIPLAMMVVQKIAKRLLGKYWDQYASLADNFLENLQGLTTLQIYRADGYMAEKMAREAEHFRKVTMKVLSMQLNSIIVMDIVAYGGAALGIAVALSSYAAGSLPATKAFACILLSADFFIPLRRLGSCFHTAMNGVTASRNILLFLDTREKERGRLALPQAEDGSPLYRARGLCCSFPAPVSADAGPADGGSAAGGGTRTALSDCDFEILPGSFTAFIGKSGSGKSTAAKLLSGIYPSYTGSLTMKGVELSSLAPEAVYGYTTYISHRDWIFKGSVRETLQEGRGGSSIPEEELWQVLEDVQLADFVKEAGGLDAALQEGGANLSGGQRQRLSIARALLHKSQVYIFDEASSNIDVESEQSILSLIRGLRGKNTVIMISHREENCREADRIYRFDKGRVQLVSKEERA